MRVCSTFVPLLKQDNAPLLSLHLEVGLTVYLSGVCITFLHCFRTVYMTHCTCNAFSHWFLLRSLIHLCQVLRSLLLFLLCCLGISHSSSDVLSCFWSRICLSLLFCIFLYLTHWQWHHNKNGNIIVANLSTDMF